MLVVANGKFVGTEAGHAPGFGTHPQALIVMVQAAHEVAAHEPGGDRGIPMLETLLVGVEDVDAT